MNKKFINLLFSLVFLTALGVSGCDEIYYPQYSGTFTLTKPAVYSDGNFNKRYFLPETLTIKDKMVYSGTGFQHNWYLSTDSKDIDSVLDFTHVTRENSGSYPNNFYDGQVIGHFDGHDAGFFCRVDYYLMIFADPEIIDPPIDLIKNMYPTHEFAHDADGNVILDQFGQPLQITLPKEKIMRDLPINEEAYDKWARILMDTRRIKIPFEIQFVINSVMSGCTDEIFPLIEYDAGSVSGLYRAGIDNLDQKSNPALESWSDYSHNSYPPRLFFTPDFGNTITPKSKKTVSLDALKQLHTSAVDRNLKIKESIKLRIKGTVNFDATDSYREKLKERAFKTCSSTCPSIVVQVQNQDDNDSNTYYLVKSEPGKEMNIQKISLANFNIDKIAEGFEFKTLLDDYLEVSVYGIIKSGTTFPGLNPVSSREERMGHLVKVVEAVASQL